MASIYLKLASDCTVLASFFVHYSSYKTTIALQLPCLPRYLIVLVREFIASLVKISLKFFQPFGSFFFLLASFKVFFAKFVYLLGENNHPYTK